MLMLRSAADARDTAVIVCAAGVLGPFYSLGKLPAVVDLLGKAVGYMKDFVYMLWSTCTMHPLEP